MKRFMQISKLRFCYCLSQTIEKTKSQKQLWKELYLAHNFCELMTSMAVTYLFLFFSTKKKGTKKKNEEAMEGHSKTII